MTVKVFVTYSHRDGRYVDSGEYSLLEYLKGLEREDVEFWSDRSLVTGENWDEKIKARIRDMDIALVLVSQAFLDSAYCVNTEVMGFLERCKGGGMVIFPIILSPCEWERYDWLKSRQFLPTNGETIEEHYTGAGNRKRLYHNIRQDLRKCIDSIRGSRKQAINTRLSKTVNAGQPRMSSSAVRREADRDYPSLISILHDPALSPDQQTELYVSAYLEEEARRKRNRGAEILADDSSSVQEKVSQLTKAYSSAMADEDAELDALGNAESVSPQRFTQRLEIRRKIGDAYLELSREMLRDSNELVKRIWKRDT